MKYNKIAMLVAGGLMVGAVSVGYGATSTTSSIVAEYGTISGLDAISLGELSITDADVTAAELWSSNVEETFCINSNTPAEENAAVSFSAISVGDNGTAPSAVSYDMGGYNVSVQPGLMSHETSALTGPRSELAYDVTLGRVDSTSHGYIIRNDSEQCTTANYSLTLTVDDTTLGQYAGNYSGSIAVTLSGHTDEA